MDFLKKRKIKSKITILVGYSFELEKPSVLFPPPPLKLYEIARFYFGYMPLFLLTISIIIKRRDTYPRSGNPSGIIGEDDVHEVLLDVKT